MSRSSHGPSAPVPFCFTQSEGFSLILQELGATLIVSTYQANKLIVLRSFGQGISTLVRTLDRPMGLALDGHRMAVGTRREIWFLRNAPDIAPQVDPVGMHDACYLPRSSHVTGDINIHEIAWGRNNLWIVNTRFSCLCTLDPDYSFVPCWKPPFITALAAEDRCHLNGLAIVNGVPGFMTALGVSNTPNGWRRDKSQGGCLIEVASGQLISNALSMPHSPRWSNDHLWVLESGTGSIVSVDPANGKSQTVVQLPGFLRGMAIVGSYAFVGLSKIRASSTLDGVPIASRRDELKCGVAAVDLLTGQCVALLEFQTVIDEVFDVQILPRQRFPEVIGFQNESLSHTFIIPQNMPNGALLVADAVTESARPNCRE